jgi:FAD/FMN-containing dehydrogenase
MQSPFLLARRPPDHAVARHQSGKAIVTVKLPVRAGCRSPGLVIRPEDVITALAFAGSQDVPLSIRSGGHRISGRLTNDGGIVAMWNLWA